ncbi:MAG: tetratricopeptide repeat protein, partial [Geminicoccales bacterium]
DITISLSRFRELFVISHHSAFLLKGEDVTVEKAGRELGVRYILGGSVRRDEKRLRVMVALTESDTGHRLWGERYDRPVDDIFVVQDELTETIVATLAIHIAAEERRRTAHAETSSLRAYGLVLRGQQMLYQFERQSNAQARWLYERALQLDARYARAYAAMSRTFNLDWRYSWAEAPRSLEKALELANAAVQLDPFDARGHSELGYVHLYRKEHDLSLAAYERALSLNPNDADMMADMADALSACGKPDEAVTLLERAMRLNPCYPDWYLWLLGGAYYQMRDYEQAIATTNSMHNLAEGRRVLAASYAQLGRMGEARAQAEEVLKVHPDFSLERWAAIQPDRNPDDTHHFIAGLRKAGLK